MGTTLTGTTPQDTYDSLIKVTDNGPLSGTAKYLSDGLGNDSVLALSTAVVGINTSSPNTNYPLSIASASNANAIAVFGRASDNTGSIDFYQNNGSSRILEFGVSTTQVDIYNDLNTPMLFSTNATERMRITGGGNVGIGTSSPATKLEIFGTGNTLRLDSATNGAKEILFRNVGTQTATIRTDGDLKFETEDSGKFISFFTNSGSGSTERVRIQAAGGISFNGDTAAANALDDYEEGTFTAALVPPTSGTITLDPTYSTWSYTKIGRKVTINGVAVISAVSSPVGSYFTMTTLPFTIITANSGYGSGSAILSDQSLSYAKSSIPVWHSVGNVALNFGLDASTLAAGDEIYVTATYFV